MLQVLLTLLHIGVALVLIAVVLLQTGKRADLAGAFGGGGSQTAFGTRGAATILSKSTTAAAVLFMLTSLSLSILSAQQSGSGRSVLEDVETPAASTTGSEEPTGSATLPVGDVDDADSGEAGAEDLPPLPDDDSGSGSNDTPPPATE